MKGHIWKSSSKRKVKIYFSWLKKYNHLYKDIDLDHCLVDTFEEDSLAASADFDRINMYHNDNKNSQDADTEYDSDESENLSLIHI